MTRSATVYFPLPMCRFVIALGLAVLIWSACSPVPPSPTPVGLSVTCAVTTLDIGQKTMCLASASYSNGASLDQTPTSAWTSSNVAIATVAQGAVTAIDAGSATVTARYQSVSGAATLVVRPGIK